MNELSFILPLAEWFVKLMDYGNKRNKAFFETIIEPCLIHAEVARNDIISICDEIEKALHTGAEPQSINDRFITIGRKSRGSRDFLRAAFEDSNENFTDFEKGIQKMLTGGSGHTIIRLHSQIYHLAKKIESNVGDTEMIELMKARQLSELNHTRKNTEDAWKMICSGYMEYSKKYISRPA